MALLILIPDSMKNIMNIKNQRSRKKSSSNKRKLNHVPSNLTESLRKRISSSIWLITGVLIIMRSFTLMARKHHRLNIHKAMRIQNQK
jgi:hypothetical protein